MFILNLKKFVKIRKSHNARKILCYLNDKAYFPKKCSRFNYLSNFYSNFPIFTINSKFIIVFDCFEIIITFLYFIIIPLKIAFEKDFNENDNFLNFLKVMFFIFYVIGLMIPFNLQTINKRGEIIVDKNKISKKYLRNNFLKSFFSIFYVFVDLIKMKISLSLSFFLAALFYMRAFDLNSKIHKISLLFSLKEQNRNILRYVKLLICILLFLHIFSCVWIFFGENPIDEEETWISANEDFKNNNFKKYITSFYYILSILMTNGFSDIKPQNYYEKFLTICVVFFSFILITRNLREIIKILVCSEESENIKIENILSDKHVPIITKLQTEKVMFQIQKGKISKKKFENEAKYDEFPQFLKNSLLQAKITNKLKEKYYLKKYFSNSFLENIASKFNKEFFNYNTLIFDNSEAKSNPRLFLIESGEIDVYLNSKIENSISFLKLKAGDIFGFHSLFTQNDFNYSFKSRCCTVLYSITKEDFLNLAKEKKEDYESYCYLKDLSTFGKYNLDFPCKFCKSKCHELFNCPKLFIDHKHRRISCKPYNFDFSSNNFDNFLRKKDKRLHALKNSKLIKEGHRKIMNDSSSDEELLISSSSSSKEEDKGASGSASRKMSSGTDFVYNDEKILGNSDDEKLLGNNDNSFISSGNNSNTSLSLMIKVNDQQQTNNRSYISNSQISNSSKKCDVLSYWSKNNKSHPLPKINEEENEQESGKLRKRPRKNRESSKIRDPFSESASFQSLIFEKDDESVFETWHEYKKYFPMNNISKFIKNKNKKNFSRKLSFHIYIYILLF